MYWKGWIYCAFWMSCKVMQSRSPLFRQSSVEVFDIWDFEMIECVSNVLGLETPGTSRTLNGASCTWTSKSPRSPTSRRKQQKRWLSWRNPWPPNVASSLGQKCGEKVWENARNSASFRMHVLSSMMCVCKVVISFLFFVTKRQIKCLLASPQLASLWGLCGPCRFWEKPETPSRTSDDGWPDEPCTCVMRKLCICLLR